MTRLRLRTQLFLAAVLTICGLTGALLFIVRHSVRVETDREVRDGTVASVRAFESVQRQRELQLSRTASMLAELPTLKALMPTLHALTIQDASAPFWRLSGSDLFILAEPDRQIVALHMTNPGWSAEAAARDLKRSIDQGEESSWWYDDGRLYWVFLRPITAGAGADSREIGLLAIGYQVNASVAEQLAQVSGSQIALVTGNDLITSTLSHNDEAAMKSQLDFQRAAELETGQVTLSSDDYAFSSVILHGALPSPVRCFVLMPLATASQFMQRLNHTIFVLGASAILFGALLFGFVARTITKPLENLVSGVRALASGDYGYSIKPEGTSEVAELSSAFSKMRGDLLASQKQQIETERIAALGRAASSISHDLRHYLAAVVANAEFLYEADQLKLDKHEIYQEIKTASTQMTDLIDSLRELAYQRNAISPEPTNLNLVIRRAIEAVKGRPEFRHRIVSLIGEPEAEGIFDPRKLERAFFNLILNACEATPDGDATVTIEIQPAPKCFRIRVIDEGPGIPESIQNFVFDPFVSSGKPSGTGLGLAIVSKIVNDHGGSVRLERTSPQGTVMLVELPRISQAVPSHSDPTIV